MYHDLKKSQYDVRSDYDITISDFREHVLQAKKYETLPTFTFDDGYKSFLIAASILDSCDMKGIFFIVTNNIGLPDYLTKHEIRKLISSGHIIGSHSHTHPNFNTLENNQVRSELRTSKSILENICNQPITAFAFPGGKYKKWHTLIAMEEGYNKVFTSFESNKIKNNLEIPRLHIRQSTKSNIHKIFTQNKIYILKRTFRSIAIEFKGLLSAK